jgi:hypothetical protein
MQSQINRIKSMGRCSTVIFIAYSMEFLRLGREDQLLILPPEM